jgi:hypothetical protein
VALQSGLLLPEPDSGGDGRSMMQSDEHADFQCPNFKLNDGWHAINKFRKR